MVFATANGASLLQYNPSDEGIFSKNESQWSNVITNGEL
jgi:hypothetical protein